MKIWKKKMKLFIDSLYILNSQNTYIQDNLINSVSKGNKLVVLFF